MLEQARDLQAGGLGALIERLREAKDNPLAAFLYARAAPALRGDAAGDEPARGLQRLGHGRGRRAGRAQRRQIRERFEAAPQPAPRHLDRIIARLTGLDLKLEQYRRGERFVSGVAAAGGREAIDAAVERPWALPSEREMADPAAWVHASLPHTLQSRSLMPARDRTSDN